MRTKVLSIWLLGFLFCVMNTAMVVPQNSEVTSSTQEKIAPLQQKTAKKWKKRFTKARAKIVKKIQGIVDGPTILIALGAVILGVFAIYYFFQMGFIAGLLAIAGISFFLYLLFKYLNY